MTTYILWGFSLWAVDIVLTATLSQTCSSFAGSISFSSNISFFLVSWVCNASTAFQHCERDTWSSMSSSPLDIGIRKSRMIYTVTWSSSPHPKKKSIFVIDWQDLPVDSIKLFLPETLLMFFGQNLKVKQTNLLLCKRRLCLVVLFWLLQVLRFIYPRSKI